MANCSCVAVTVPKFLELFNNKKVYFSTLWNQCSPHHENIINHKNLFETVHWSKFVPSRYSNWGGELCIIWEAYRTGIVIPSRMLHMKWAFRTVLIYQRKWSLHFYLIPKFYVTGPVAVEKLFNHFFIFSLFHVNHGVVGGVGTL